MKLMRDKDCSCTECLLGDVLMQAKTDALLSDGVYLYDELVADLELLAFDDEEVAGRLEIMGHRTDAATVDAVKAEAAKALADDPGPY